MKGQFIMVPAILLILIPSIGIFPHKLYAQSIIGVSPNPACVGDTLTVTGSNFDDVIGGAIGNDTIPLLANSLSSSSFQVIVPADLAFDNDSPTGFTIEARIPNETNPTFEDPVLISPEISLSISFGAGQTATICGGNSTEMTVEANPPDPEGDFSYSYTWTPANSLSSADEATVSASPSEMTAYTVEVSAGAGCPYTETVDVDVRSKPSLDSVIVLSNVCEDENGEIEIIASGDAPLEYRLIPGSSAFSTNPIFSNLDTGTYDLQIRYAESPRCRKTFDEVVTINEMIESSLSASILGPVEDDSICIGDSFMLIAANDSAATSYTWTLSSGGQADTLKGLGPISASFTTIGEQDITLTVSDGECTVSESLTIYVDGLETSLDIKKDQSQICLGDQVIFSVDTLEEAIFTWDFGAEASPVMTTGNGPDTVMFSTTGVQRIRLTIDQGGCPAIVRDSIVVNPVPTISVFPSIPTQVVSGETIELTVQTSVEPTIFQWEVILGDGLDSMAALSGQDSLIRQVFTLNRNADAVAQYLITAMTDNGCIDTLAFSFTVANNALSSGFSAPDVFTPNGDGYNDTWSIVLPQDLIASEHVLVIFNRSGGLIFEEDASVSWNGRNVRNGQAAPAGPYWYLVFHKESREETLWSGVVTLIR